MKIKQTYAVVIPLSNEGRTFHRLVAKLTRVLDEHPGGRVYLVTDNSSHDNTNTLVDKLADKDNRFFNIYDKSISNVVEAYLAGFRMAYRNKHDYIIEMDGGLSHQPDRIPYFLYALRNYECAFGSRFISGGGFIRAPFNRVFLSRVGTFLSGILLGTTLKDMTSGYEGFRRKVLGKILNYKLRSTGHFYQTEVRYLLRNYSSVEIPIIYCDPSERVSKKSIKNAIETLIYYFFRRIQLKSHSL